jgi:hypothetical protein
MNIDFGFVTTPAKARLLCSLKQYPELKIELNQDIIDMAKINISKKYDDKKADLYQFLCDVGNRCGVAKRINSNSFDLSFMIETAYDNNHKVILMSTHKDKANALVNKFKGLIYLHPVSFFLDINFATKMKEYEDHLVILDLDDSELDESSFKRAVYYHFKKIWAFVEINDAAFLWTYRIALLVKYLTYDFSNNNKFITTKPKIYHGIFMIDETNYF